MSNQPLLGRDRELAELATVLADAQDEGCAVALVGDPGVGKSALQSALVEGARARGHAVLMTRGSREEQHLPFAALHQLLRPVLGGATELPSRQREALLSAFGVLDAGQPDPFLISLAALELVSTLAASAPVLMSIDDAHWVDRPTLDAVTFIARRLEAEPIAVVMSVRPEYAAGLDRSIRRIAIDALDLPAAEELVTREHPGLRPLLRERVLRLAGGNPLAMLELPIAAAGHSMEVDGALAVLPVTETLELAFAERARQLPVPTLTALTVAAIDDGSGLTEILAAATCVPGHGLGPATGTRRAVGDLR